MFELLIHLAELLGGVYEVLPDGSVKASDLLGMLAGCGAVDPAETVTCVDAAIEFEGGK